MSIGAAPPPAEAALGRLGRWMARIEDALLVALLAAMILFAAVQIILRNMLDTGIAWNEPLLRILVLWVGLIGAVVATREDRQINVDIVARFLGARGQAAARLVTDLFTAGVTALLAWHGARFVALDWEEGTRAFAAVPAWACELVIPLGFGLIALRCLANLPLRLRTLFRPAA